MTELGIWPADMERAGGAIDLEMQLEPDLDPAVLAALLASSFTVAPASDRAGTRLLGPPLPASVHSARDRRSAPMVRGAIELTPSGPIVLGPDHPTTGGYPVIAVLCEHAQDAFFARPVVAAVRFVD